MALKKIIPPATSKANGSKRFENEAPIGNKADPSHPPSKDATDKHKIGTSNPGTKPSNLPKPAPNAVEKASGKTVPEKAPAVTKPEPQKTVAATVSKVVASKADVTGKGKPPAQPASKAALPIPSVKPTAAKAIPPKTDSKVGVKNIVPAATKIKPAALPVRKQSVAAIPISRKQSVATPSVAAKSAPAKSQLPKAAPEKANAVNAKDKIAAAPAHTKSSNAKPTTATKGAISSPVKSAAPSEPIAAKASAPVKTLPAKTVNAESPKQKPNPESRLTAEKGFKSAVALPTPSKSSAPSPSMAVSAIDKRDQTAISPANTSRLPISIPLKPSTASAPLDQTRSRAASEKKSQSKTIAKSSHNIKNAAGRGTGSVKKLAAPESKMQSVAAGATQTAATISGKKDAQPTIAKIKPVTAGFSVAKPVAAHFKAAIDKKSQGHSRVSSPAPESESKNAKPPRVSSPAPEIEKLKSQKPSPAPIVEKAKSQKPSRVSSPALEIAKNNEKPAPQAPLSFKKSKLPEPVESPPRARPTTKEAKSKAGLSKPITPKTIQKSRFKSLIPVRKRAINSKIDITLRELSKTVHSINILHAKARKSGLITGNRKTSMSMHLETTDPDATEASIRADYEVERQERTKLERANADLHQQISVMQRRLLKEQEKLRGFPKINMQVPTSVEVQAILI